MNATTATTLDPGQIDNFEASLAGAILAIPGLAGIPVLQDPQGNITDMISEKIGKISRIIVPFAYEANDDNSGIEGTMWSRVPFMIGVFHNPKVVYAGPSARNICEQIAAGLKGYCGWPRPITLDTPAIKHIPDPQLNMWEVCGWGAVDGTILPALPVITGAAAGGLVTLACAQPGAAIFYTTDGTWPTPLGGILYTAPFPAAGVPINARAWLAGLLTTPLFTLNT